MPLNLATSPAQPSRSAAGNSYNPIFSADGRYLAFVSQANNLVTNDDLGLSLDVFVRDLTNQTTTLVSINTNGIGGGNFDANYPSISSSGQWVAFASAASNLVPSDTNELSDVFVRDLASGITRLVSVEYTGTGCANGKSSAPQISADGRWVIFESMATNLVAGQFTTNWIQIYARDLQSNLTYLVSVNDAGTGPGQGKTGFPAISADGQRIVFVGTATNLVAGVTNQQGEIYLRDLAAGVTTWASSNLAGYFTDFTNGYRCFNPVLSQDGTRLAFKAAAGGSLNQSLVFWMDLNAGNTVCVASNSLDTSWPELSGDGRFLAYESGTNVLVWDNLQQTNLFINIGYDGVNPANGPARRPVVSADGRTVLFHCSATDMAVSNAPVASSNQVFQLYARSLESNVTWLVSANVASEASGVSLEHFMPAISPDGRLVAFESADDYLVSGDQNRASDIFVRNLAAGQTELISVRHDARPARTGTGNCFVHLRSISGDGRYALISSSDNGLGENDTNQVSDLYLLDLVAGTNRWMYVPTNAITTNIQPMIYPIVSENGESLAFLRHTQNSGGGQNNYAKEGFVFKLASAELKYFNLNPTGGVVQTAIDTYAYANDLRMFGMCFSPDGQKLAFSALGAELMFGAGTWNNNVYLHNLASGSNTLVSHSFTNANVGGNNHSTSPQFSPDGRWISFVSSAYNLATNAVNAGRRIWALDTQTDTLRMVMFHPYPTNTVFSPGSRYLAFDSYYTGLADVRVYIHDLYTATPTNVSVTTNMIKPAVSYDAEVVAMQSLPTNGITHVFAKDVLADKLELISVATDGITPGNGASSPPQITADGRFVLFASTANNLVPNDTNGRSDVFLRDRQLSLTYLLSANPKTGRSGNRPSTSPLLSSDGSTIIFASLANDLAEADYNDKQDIFVVKLARGDSDADGLDDAWEMAYFGNLAQDGSGDADGDGLKDREEYRAGTDPANQGSVLRALAMAPVGGQSTTLMWPAATGRQYQIQFKRSVTDTNWTILPTTITVTGNTASAVDTQAGLDAARFYRILLLP